MISFPLRKALLPTLFASLLVIGRCALPSFEPRAASQGERQEPKPGTGVKPPDDPKKPTTSSDESLANTVSDLAKSLRENTKMVREYTSEMGRLAESLRSAREPDSTLPYSNLNKALMTGELVVSPQPSISFRFVYVPPGRFPMGYGKQDIKRLVNATKNAFITDNAQPLIHIHVTEGYFLLDREITIGQFAAFEKATGLRRLAVVDDPDANCQPVRNVSWEDAMHFCRWLQCELGTGHVVRLPTEVEWEYAARGPWQQMYPWADFEVFHAWAEKEEDARPRPYDCNSRDVSWRGVYDLAGNVSEWCLDLYNDHLYEALQQQGSYSPMRAKPQQSPAGIVGQRTYRGGSFRDTRLNCEVSVRRAAVQDTRDPVIGFRPVLVVIPNWKQKRSEP